MKTKLGLGLLTAGLLAYSGAAQAVTQAYTGLAFNSLTPFSSYSRIADEVGDLAFGGFQLNQAGTIELGLGQANYTVTGTSIDNAGGLIGGSIDFGPSTVGMDFGGNTMFITGGHIEIKNNNGAQGWDQPLPFGLGVAAPDYELQNGYIDVLLNGVAMTFSLCESGGLSGDCNSTGNDEPWGGTQPYNTLNVGDNGGDDDLAMFLYMKGECADDSCPFYVPGTPDTYERYVQVDTEVEQTCRRPNGSRSSSTYPCRNGWNGYYWQTREREIYGWVADESCGDQAAVDFRQDDANGTFAGGSQVTSMVGTNRGPRPGDCKRIRGERADSDIYLKIALWGEGDEGDVPAPATLSLLGLGLFGLGAATRRRRKAA